MVAAAKVDDAIQVLGYWANEVPIGPQPVGSGP